MKHGEGIIELVVAEDDRWDPGEPLCRAFTLADFVDGDASARGRYAGGRFLINRPLDKERRLRVPVKDCIRVPAEIDTHLACQVPLVAFALQAWDRVGLELGEVALIAGSGHVARTLSRVALWYGALPVIHLAKAIRESYPGVNDLLFESEEPERVMQNLTELTRGKAGFAAIDISGEPDTIDFLFESIPFWGRLMLASERTEPLTIDYYRNIHRKGIHLVTGVAHPGFVFEAAADPANREYLDRALRVLATRKLAGDLYN